MSVQPREYNVGVVLFDDFELLDVYGPLEMLGEVPQLSISLIGPSEEPVKSVQGPRAVVDVTYAEALAPDMLLVPGGMGTRRLVENRDFLEWVSECAYTAKIVSSVCTGSAVLAAAGVLDGYSATTNKQAFNWVSQHGSNVNWVKSARWVQDRNRWTSSGVSAGMDMALAIVAHLADMPTAYKVADEAEYDWHSDPSWDPFAVKNKLV